MIDKGGGEISSNIKNLKRDRKWTLSLVKKISPMKAENKKQQEQLAGRLAGASRKEKEKSCLKVLRGE